MSKDTKSKGENSAKNQKKSGNESVSVQKLEDALSSTYEFRNNIILNQIEYRFKNAPEFQPVNTNSIFRHLHYNSVPISMVKLKIILGSDYVEEYNPITDYFIKCESLYSKEEHGDYINELLNYCDVENHGLFVRTFKVWMVNAIRTIFEPKAVNKTIYVLFNNIQNSGKTTFIRSLFPDELRDYTFENQLNDSKDGKITLAKCAFHILDEMVALSQMGMESFKALVSKDKIDLRPPYGVNIISRPRISSFIGSSDRFGFLKEDVGTARFVIQEINGFDFAYSKNINPNIIWSQAYNYYKNKQFLEISKLDKLDIQEFNKRYIRTSFITEAINEIIIPSTKLKGEFLQAKDIVNELQITNGRIAISDRKIGDALNHSGFERVRHYDTKRKMTLNGYYVEFINSKDKQNNS